MGGVDLTTLLAWATGLVVLANAAEKIAKAWRIYKAPNARQDEEINGIKKHLEEVDGYLAADKKRLDSPETEPPSVLCWLCSTTASTATTSPRCSRPKRSCKIT